MPRQYAMGSRADAMKLTRESILDAAVELFGPAWYDEVTLADVARRSGVSQQTVVNHFGSKLQLFLTGLDERFAPGVAASRAAAVPGDVPSVVDAVLADYEATGDATVRTIALAGRLSELTSVVENGRRWHHDWVASVFAPQLGRVRGKRGDRRRRLLAAVLDVSMWHQLRRDDGLSVEETRTHLLELVEGVLAR